jgi:hypothetical protein
MNWTMDSYRIDPYGPPPPGPLPLKARLKDALTATGRGLKAIGAAFVAVLVDNLYDQFWEAMGVKAAAWYLAIFSTAVTALLLVIWFKRRGRRSKEQT